MTQAISVYIRKAILSVDNLIELGTTEVCNCETTIWNKATKIQDIGCWLFVSKYSREPAVFVMLKK